jgi:20S proteasome subunit beta 5
LAFTYEPATPADKGGIIVSVDSRATGGAHIGRALGFSVGTCLFTFLASKTVMKMLDVAPHLVATMAGGAADCQFWIRYLAKYCKLYEMREKEPISVAAASKYLANVLYGYKGRGLSIGTLIGGYDKTGRVQPA